MLDVINFEVAMAEKEEKEKESRRYVCLAFAHEGIAQTDWGEHGSCEMWTPKQHGT